QPVCAVARRNHYDLSENLRRAAEIGALERGIGLAAKRSGGFRHLARLGLGLRFQFDRPIGEIVALERPLGSQGGGRQQQDERGCKGSANERAHGAPPFPSGWGSRTGRRDQPQTAEVVAERDGRPVRALFRSLSEPKKSRIEFGKWIKWLSLGRRPLAPT